MKTEYNKKDLFKDIENETNIDIDVIEEVFSTFLKLTATHVANEGRVEYKGLGTFNIESRQKRSGTFAPTGAKWETPARMVVTFKAAPEFLKIANENRKDSLKEFEITNKK
jgi:nucleoid DNA-binding protein